MEREKSYFGCDLRSSNTQSHIVVLMLVVLMLVVLMLVVLMLVVLDTVTHSHTLWC